MRATFNLRTIIPCLLAVFVDILGFSLAMPAFIALFSSTTFLPDLVSETTRFSYLAIALVLYPLFMFFGASFMGDLSDRVGRKKVLILCMGGFVIGFFIIGLGASQQSLFLLYLGRILTGLTAASLPVTMAAIIDLSTPKNKATHMSLVVFVQSLGIIVGPLMVGILSDSQIVHFFNPSSPFYAASFLALASLLLIAYFFRESFERTSKKKIRFLRVIFIFAEVAKHPRIRILAVSFFLHQIGIGLYLQLILIYLGKMFSYTSFKMGIFNSFVGLWLAIGLILIPPLVKRFRIEWIACISIGLLGLSELFAATFSSAILVWVGGIWIGITGNIAWSSILTSFSEAADSTNQGWALGISGSIVALAFIITGFSPNLVPIIGALPVIGAGGFCTLIASLILFYYCRKKLTLR